MENIINTEHLIKVLLPAGIAIAAALLINLIISTLIKKAAKKKHVPIAQTQMARLMVRWGIIMVMIVVVASIFGMGIGKLWTTLAGIAAMVLIGFFAMWSVLSNVFATFVILISRPFRIGDTITILPENITGVAHDIGLLYCKLKTEDGQNIIIPTITFLTKFTAVKKKS